MAKLKVHHMFAGEAFVHESATSWTHSCCDCGQSHNIELTVMNAEEIKVQYFRNDSVTDKMRSDNRYEFVSLGKCEQSLIEMIRNGDAKGAAKYLKSTWL